MAKFEAKWAPVSQVPTLSHAIGALSVPPARTASRSRVTMELMTVIGYHNANRVFSPLCDDLVDIIVGYAVASDLWFALCMYGKIAAPPNGAHSLMCLDETDCLPANGSDGDERERRSWELPLSHLKVVYPSYVDVVTVGETVYILSTRDCSFCSIDVGTPSIKLPTVELLPTPTVLDGLQWVGVSSGRHTIYVCGGENRVGQVQSGVHKYDVESRTWSQDGQMPIKLRAHTLSFVQQTSRISIATDDDILIVAGGQDENYNLKADCVYRSISSAEWKVAPAFECPRKFHSAAVWNGYLVVAGGNGGTSDTLEALDLNRPERGWLWVGNLPRLTNRLNTTNRPWRLIVANGELTAVPYTFYDCAFEKVVPVITIDPESCTVSNRPPIYLNSTFFHGDTLVAVPCQI